MDLKEIDWEDVNWLRIWTGGEFYGDSNESSVFLKRGEFLDSLWSCQLLKKDCAPWSDKY
jgi:hypothetical protein